MPAVVQTLLLVFLAFTAAAPALSDDEDISLQWAICDTDAETVLAKLDQEDDQPYKSNPIVYYDTWPPQYTRSGIAFRTKVKKHDPGYPISMIKARFGEYNENVPPTAGCVWNRYGNDTTYTCGLSNVLTEVGGAEGEAVWSEEQVAFAKRYLRIDWKQLVPFGPYQNPKWKLPLLGQKVVFDDVRALPLHLMEIEVVVPRRGSREMYNKMDSFLRARGVEICAKQMPKTLRLLEWLENQKTGGFEQDAGSYQAVMAL